MSTTADLGQLRATRRRSALLRWAIAAGAAVAVAGLGALAWFSPLLAIDTVTAEGGGIVDADAVRADVEARTAGTPLPRVRTGAVAHEMTQQYTAAADIDVSYAGPRSLHVTIVDRSPVIAIVEGSEAVRYDADGASIDTVPAEGLRLPVLTTAVGADAPAAARDGARLLTEIDGTLPGAVGELSVDAAGTFTLTLETEEGTAEAVFGSADQAERKARVAAVLIEEGHETIDVSVPDVPTVS